MSPHLNTAVSIIRKLGKNILIAFNQLNIKTMVDEEIDLYIKFMRDQCIIETKMIINKLYPNHKIIFDYNELIDYNSFCWIIGIFDNDVNIKKGLHEISLSIAIIYKNCVNDCVIYDIFKNNIFTASKNAGAKLNGKRIKVSNHCFIEHSLININFFNSVNYMYYCKYIRNLLFYGAVLRTTGSLSLSLAYVAAGIYDGYICTDISKMENNFIFANKLLICESGGYISNILGEDTIKNNILSANPKLYIKLLKLLNNVY